MFTRFLSRSRLFGIRGPIRRPFGRRFNGTTAKPAAPEPKPTGMKAFMKTYGYSGLGVYLALSMLDLPLCFLLVHSMGQDKVKEWQDKALNAIGWNKDKSEDVGTPPDADTKTETTQNQPSDTQNKPETTTATTTTAANIDSKKPIVSETFWTELALAYAIHKSLIVIRLPIAAAITPAVVKYLQRFGFDIGRLPAAASAAVKNVQKDGVKKTLSKQGRQEFGDAMKYDATASNPKFGKPPSKGQRWFFF